MGTIQIDVDSGIARLAEIRNTFDKVTVFESCHGWEGVPPFVLMEYGGEAASFWDKAKFIHRLAKILADITKQGTGISPDPAYDISLELVWDGDKTSPYISLKFPMDSVVEVTNLFVSVQKRFVNGKKGMLS